MIVIVCIIIVVLIFSLPGIIFSFGMFNPSSFQSSIATGFNNIGHPLDWEYSGSTFRITLGNIASTMIIERANVTGCDILSIDEDLVMGGSLDLEFTNCRVLPPGKSYSVVVELIYNDDGYSNIETGRITGIAI
jgi:hypothetical protein